MGVETKSTVKVKSILEVLETLRITIEKVQEKKIQEVLDDLGFKNGLQYSLYCEKNECIPLYTLPTITAHTFEFFYINFIYCGEERKLSLSCFVNEKKENIIHASLSKWGSADEIMKIVNKVFQEQGYDTVEYIENDVNNKITTLPCKPQTLKSKKKINKPLQ